VSAFGVRNWMFTLLPRLAARVLASCLPRNASLRSGGCLRDLLRIHLFSRLLPGRYPSTDPGTAGSTARDHAATASNSRESRDRAAAAPQACMPAGPARTADYPLLRAPAACRGWLIAAHSPCKAPASTLRDRCYPSGSATRARYVLTANVDGESALRAEPTTCLQRRSPGQARHRRED